MLAEGYLQAGERAKAFAILEELLQAHPGDHELLLLLDSETPSQLRSARGGRAESRWQLDDAEAWLKDGKLAEAEESLKRARKKEKTDRADWVELQLAWHRNPGSALAKALAFSTSARHPRLCFLALRAALDLLMEKEDEAGVFTALEAFLAAHPKSSGAWEAAVIRQAYRLMSGRVGEDDLAEVRRLNAKPLPGQEARVRSLLGQYLLELGKPEEVVDIVGPLLKSEPTLIHHFQLGTALAVLGERNEARAVLQAGLEAEVGELPQAQADLVRTKLKGLLQELEKQA
jgi:predicted Zn-dependent protease